MNEKEKPVKAYEFVCCNENCKHEWISKKDDNTCPECGSTILDYQKLR